MIFCNFAILDRRPYMTTKVSANCNNSLLPAPNEKWATAARSRSFTYAVMKARIYYGK
jgi:hypothetical protein